MECLVKYGDVPQERVDEVSAALDSIWKIAGGLLDSPAFERTRNALATPSPTLALGEDARDAARYRFLRTPGNATVYAKDLANWNREPHLPKGTYGYFRYNTPEQLDAAIDVALAQVLPR